MIIKFSKNQIKALASIRGRAESMFNDFQAKQPHLYREEDRARTVRAFQLGILDSIIELGEIFLEDK